MIPVAPSTQQGTNMPNANTSPWLMVFPSSCLAILAADNSFGNPPSSAARQYHGARLEMHIAIEITGVIQSVQIRQQIPAQLAYCASREQMDDHRFPDEYAFKELPL
jgi:hypothetical protein